MTLLLGAVADDFTGATDLANTLVQQGMRVTQLIGVPDEQTDIGDAQAVVIALKSRMAPAGDAIDWSMEALKWLQRRNAHQFFFKYCSTFDSTAEGNIGPVGDALHTHLASDITVICPAFPDNGRTIYKGNLFVNDVPLSESPMREHPLTPMRDSNLMRVMEAQSNLKTANIDLNIVRKGPDSILAAMEKCRTEGYGYCVVDATNNEDLDALGEAIADHVLITGGSAVARGLPDNYRRAGKLGEPETPILPGFNGRSIVLAGSCSVATRAQIAHVSRLWPVFKIDVDALADGSLTADAIVTWVLNQSGETPVLVYASADPEEVAQTQQKYGIEKAGSLVEDVMGKTAGTLASSGVRKFVVAGGETSGAVVEALDIKGLRIGPEIDPGVPWTESIGENSIALALKSGNFGGNDFFVKALDMLG
jgi:3-dehydrotetronate 4-kinase